MKRITLMASVSIGSFSGAAGSSQISGRSYEWKVKMKE